MNVILYIYIYKSYRNNVLNDVNLNNDTALHIKGDTEINGNLFVYQNSQLNIKFSVRELNLDFNELMFVLHHTQLKII